MILTFSLGLPFILSSILVLALRLSFYFPCISLTFSIRLGFLGLPLEPTTCDRLITWLPESSLSLSFRICTFSAVDKVRGSEAVRWQARYDLFLAQGWFCRILAVVIIGLALFRVKTWVFMFALILYRFALGYRMGTYAGWNAEFVLLTHYAYILCLLDYTLSSL